MLHTLKTFFIHITCGLMIMTACQTVNETSSPNIIFILADDLGWSQLGCYGGPYTTPNIDQLATDGMRFTHAYAAAAVCSPTRAAIMTGKYPARLHLTDFIKGSSFPDSLLKQPEWQKFLPLEEVTVAELLKTKGYTTASFGKWHLSQEKMPPESAPYNPDKQGFDEYMVTYKPQRHVTDPERDPHNVDSISNRAIRFLREHSERPFFLYITHNAIHDPVMESRDHIARFEGDSALEEHEIWPVLAAMVHTLDQGVGKVLRAVDELGLRENTVVMFYSDNGGKETYASQYPLRKGKGWLYEGGIRVPLIVRWPGRIKNGTLNDHLVSSIDFLPTLAELAGVEQIPDVDGLSFYPQWFRNDPVNTRLLFWHYPHYHRGSGMKPAGAVSDGRYKLIEWYEASLSGNPDAYELYDLERDIGETNNLMAQFPNKAKFLRQSLEDWRKGVDAQMPTIR